MYVFCWHTNVVCSFRIFMGDLLHKMIKNSLKIFESKNASLRLQILYQDLCPNMDLRSFFMNLQISLFCFQKMYEIYVVHFIVIKTPR